MLRALILLLLLIVNFVTANVIGEKDKELAEPTEWKGTTNNNNDLQLWTSLSPWSNRPTATAYVGNGTGPYGNNFALYCNGNCGNVTVLLGLNSGSAHFGLGSSYHIFDLCWSGHSGRVLHECNINVSNSNLFYIYAYAYEPFAGAVLLAIGDNVDRMERVYGPVTTTTTLPPPTPEPSTFPTTSSSTSRRRSVTANIGEHSQGEYEYYTVICDGNCQNIEIVLSMLDGNLDLVVGTTKGSDDLCISNADGWVAEVCHDINVSSNTFHIRVYAYRAISGGMILINGNVDEVIFNE